MHALLHAAHAVEARLEQALGAHGLSIARHGVLQQMAGAAEPLTLTELADRLKCVRSNITQLVDRLEADGLVKRVDDSQDRRIIRAALTPLGIERHAAGTAAFEAVQHDIAARVPALECEALVRALAKLA